jgi:hypothetical protein
MRVSVGLTLHDAIAIAAWAVAPAVMSPCARTPVPTDLSFPSPLAESAKPAGAAPTEKPEPVYGARFALGNRFAYIPAPCYTKTRDGASGPAHNPCFACHVHSKAPNDVDDGALQLTFSLPAAAAHNPWTNLFDPPVTHGPQPDDDAVLAYVRRSNYFEGHDLAIPRALDRLEDPDGSPHAWDGFRPDAWYDFDDHGFDHRPDGAFTGWRAFAYAPFLGMFFPTNGSTDDVLVRLDPRLREDEDGRFDARVYAVNLAVVEAAIARRSVPIDPTDETRLGVDLDGNGALGIASRVAFGRTMHFVGRVRLDPAPGFVPTPGLFPLGTEFLHSVRYLDVGAGSEGMQVRMAARMKELRYARKARWLSPSALAVLAAREKVEEAVSATGVTYFAAHGDEGVTNGRGWLFQGFIEGRDGALRPQSYEETVACVGCHGGIGATTDSTFAFARKQAGPARGWYHWSQHGLAGLPEPRRRDGGYEYTLYLTANGAGDDLRENAEVQERFFDARGRLRPDAVARLHEDAGTLLLPSPRRAVDLDRAYLAVVRDQSFVRGREPVLAPATHVYEAAPIGEATGVARAIAGD